MKKQMKNMTPPDDELKKIEAIIRSMTIAERENHKILNGSRRLRIANGSGTEVKDVNKFVKQFEEAKKMNTLVTPGVSAIAPIDLQHQPETLIQDGYVVGIDPMSKHCIPAIDKMGGFPVRLAPNACPGEDDPYDALKILRQAYDKAMSAS